MIETVVSVGLPIDEKLIIQKQHIAPKTVTPGTKRISVVTGTHGDELEGQYVCYELIRRINKDIGSLSGIVDVYPALNPLGIDSITRGIPGFDLDMNRTFPGACGGTMAEHVAYKIAEDIKGSDVCVDIHASNIFLREIPQVRISEQMADELVPLAKKLNIDFVWVHSAATVLQSTLAHSLNTVGTRTLVVEMGVGMRITLDYCSALVDGILCLMKELGIWSGDTVSPREPIVSTDGNVGFINASTSGLFVPAVTHSKNVKCGDRIGDIVNPLTGMLEDEVLSPCSGLVFTLREYTVVDEGSLIARILEI